MANEAREQKPAAAKGRQAQGSRGDRTPIRPRPERYLVGVTPPTDVRTVTAELDGDPSCRVIRTVGGQHQGAYPRVTVVEMAPERAAALSGRPGLHVEQDSSLTQGATIRYGAARPEVGELRTVSFEVLDDGGRPIDGAAVCLEGAPFAAFTGADGKAEVLAPAEVEALLVYPPRGCWPVRVARPRLVTGEPNRAVCTRITTTNPEFPDRPIESWGMRVMGFDRLPPTHRGHAVRIALIDSGVAVGHPDLTGLTSGRDVVGQDAKSWQEDLVGTGTHHAVLIAGRDDGSGVVGLAPEAEIHVCRIAPGGWNSDLIEALDYCIEQQIDVALLAYGTRQASALVAAKIDEARRNGVACVAAVGDDGEARIGYPAAYPGVLAVGAIGRIGTFPPDSADVGELSGTISPEGFFVPRSSNGGWGVDCCAPGVAIVSGLPPTSYGPRGGTGVAAAHVTAVAALVLGHHPMFRPEQGRIPVTRSSVRVDHLFEVIKASCRPLPGLDPRWTGAGLPDAAVAVGVAPRGTHASYGVAPPVAAGEPDALLAPLDAAMRSAGLVEG
ncbi:S8 family serine peptidase [Nonomuraea sp. NPDC050556]|uniref:S8 family serine peptidase n=1 Tax=Nonomuraea sp. NPDC050556 TaxID=3364369 RepID=UPI0037A14EFB